MTNTANSGGEYSQGFDVKEASKKLKIQVFFSQSIALNGIELTVSHQYLKILHQVVSRNEREMEFDMIGYDPSMVNALRRLVSKSSISILS